MKDLMLDTSILWARGIKENLPDLSIERLRQSKSAELKDRVPGW